MLPVSSDWLPFGGIIKDVAESSESSESSDWLPLRRKNQKLTQKLSEWLLGRRSWVTVLGK